MLHIINFYEAHILEITTETTNLVLKLKERS